MKRRVFYGILCLAAVSVALSLLPGLRQRRARERARQASVRLQAYRQVRDAALRISRTGYRLAAPSNAADPWGVMVDFAFDAGSASLFALADGRLNTFLSDPECLDRAGRRRPQILGRAGEFQAWREASTRFFEAARELRRYAHPAQTCPSPAPGEVRWCFLTDSGIQAAAASEEALHVGPFAKLAEARRDVMDRLGCSGKLP